MPYTLVRSTVEDFAKWKAVYDEHASVRRAAGSIGAQVFQNAETPNQVTVLIEWDSLENAHKFVQSQDLRDAMERAGVIGPPDISFLNRADTSSA